MRKNLLILLFFIANICSAQVAFSLRADGRFLTSEGADKIVLDCGSVSKERLRKNLVSAFLHQTVYESNQVVSDGDENINVMSMRVPMPKDVLKDYINRNFNFNLRVKVLDGKIIIYEPILYSVYKSGDSYPLIISEPEYMFVAWEFYSDKGLVKKADRVNYINFALNKVINDVIKEALGD